MNGSVRASTAPDRGTDGQDRPWKLISLFVFALAAFGTLLIITRADANPSQTNWFIYLTVLALAAAGVAALLPGAINFEVPGALKAGGALAVFALIFWQGAGKASPVNQDLSMSSFLVFDTQASVSPFDSDVYVFLNHKVAKVDQVTSERPLYSVQDNKRSSMINIKRAKEGGFRIDFDKLLKGDRVYVVVHSPNGDWRSDDLVIPESNFPMRPVNHKAGLQVP